ncbi:MAG TPA: 2-methylisocitrate lyase, partial [Rhodospirillaceae bacterium]|nr:2-methylisocitrate lyase [Rhodospirillaceae bacterium]
AFARLAYGSLLAAAQEIQDHGSFGFSAHAAGFAAIEHYFRKSP